MLIQISKWIENIKSSEKTYAILSISLQEYHIVHGIHRKAIWCRKIWNSFAISVAYEIYMIYILLLVPVIIMTFAYVNICLELWHISSFQSRQQRRLVSVPFCFTFCTSIFHLSSSSNVASSQWAVFFMYVTGNGVE